MSWRITFFNERVKREALGFPEGVLSNLLHVIEIIEEFGPSVGRPYTAPMGHGLFEIRARGKEGAGRALFCAVKNKEIIILHSFIKKTQKTPQREIDLARKRMKEI